jgi:DHA3 family macrolide efflux protein-like MFS transporter
MTKIFGQNSVDTERRLTPFVLLQLASITSLAGGSMIFLLMPWVAIQLTHQATSAGLVVTISSIPGLLISPIIGSVIDKIGRRRSAVWSELLGALVNVGIPLLAIVFTMNLPILIGFSVIRSIVGSGGGTARKSLIPDVAAAGKISLERANSIHESVFAAGFAIGPALASICILGLGPYNSFWVVAALGLVSGLITLLIRVTEQRELHDDDEGRKFWSFAIQGFKVLFETPSVLLLMASIMSLAVIYLPTELVVLPAYYNHIGRPQDLGFLISAMAICSTAGSLSFERMSKRFRFSSLLRITMFGVAVAMVPMSFLPPQWAMLAFGVLLGFTWGPLGPLLNTVIQRKIPANKRGRVFSLEMTIWTAGPMISMTATGWATDTIGVSITYKILAGLVLVAAIVVATQKTIKQLDTAEFDFDGV